MASHFINKYELAKRFLQVVFDQLMLDNNWEKPTQQMLAEEIGVNQSMISQVARSKKYFSLKCYEKYCDRKGMPYDAFMASVLRTELCDDSTSRMVRSENVSVKLAVSQEWKAGAFSSEQFTRNIDNYFAELMSVNSVNADFQGVLRELARLNEVGQGAVFLRKPGTDQFHTAATLKPQRWESNERFYRIGEGVTGWILRHKTVLRVKDLRDSDELRAYHPTDPPVWEHKSCRLDSEISARKAYAYLGAPIFKDDIVFGVIRLVNVENEERHFSDGDEDVIVHVANGIADLLAHGEPSNVTDAIVRLQQDNEVVGSYKPYGFIEEVLR